MRWPVFAVFAFVFLVLEVSLGNVLLFGTVQPSFVVVLAVFLSLFGSRLGALWGCWILGLLVDLNISLMHGYDRAGPLLGAYALGYPFGCVLLLQVRAMLFRRRALTFATMTFICMIAVSVVVVAVYSAHGWYPNEELHWSEIGAAREMLRRLGAAVYSSVLALAVGPLLVWTLPVWAFRSGPQRAAGWR